MHGCDTTSVRVSMSSSRSKSITAGPSRRRIGISGRKSIWPTYEYLRRSQRRKPKPRPRLLQNTTMTSSSSIGGGTRGAITPISTVIKRRPSMATSLASNDRFARQKDLVPAERLAELLITVIGIGSIGRQVARTLAAIGARRMQVVDFDRVEDTNRTTQGYLLDDVGQLKVKATAADIARLDPSIKVEL